MAKKKNPNGRHLYACCVKILFPDGTDDVYKWHTSDLLKFTSFLDSKYPNDWKENLGYKIGWKWFNVYEHFHKKYNQLESFTVNKRPRSKHI